MKRGEIVVVAMVGDYGKPRPALIVQSDVGVGIGSIVVVPITGHLAPENPFRIDVSPVGGTGLRQQSQIMVDKVAAVPSAKIGARIGAVDVETLGRVDRALRALLGLD